MNQRRILPFALLFAATALLAGGKGEESYEPGKGVTPPPPPKESGMNIPTDGQSPSNSTTGAPSGGGTTGAPN